MLPKIYAGTGPQELHTAGLPESVRPKALSYGQREGDGLYLHWTTAGHRPKPWDLRVATAEIRRAFKASGGLGRLAVVYWDCDGNEIDRHLFFFED